MYMKIVINFWCCCLFSDYTIPQLFAFTAAKIHISLLKYSMNHFNWVLDVISKEVQTTQDFEIAFIENQIYQKKAI